MLDQCVTEKIPTANRPPPDIPEIGSPGAAGTATGAKVSSKCSPENNNSKIGESKGFRDRARAITPGERELLDAWRSVANAKLNEFRRQVWRLSLLVKQGTVEKSAAVNRLWEIATAHALVRALGEDRVQAILSEAFAGVSFRPMCVEAA